MKARRISLIEPVLIIFLTTGLFKDLIGFFYMPLSFDLTVFSGVICLVLLTQKLLLTRNKTIERSFFFYANFLALAAFSIWLCSSYYFSDSVVYKTDKLLGYTTAIIAYVTIGLYPSLDLKRMLAWYVAVTTFAAILFLLAMVKFSHLSGYQSIKDLYLQVGTFLGISALIVWFIFKRQFGWSIGARLLYLLFVIVVIWLLGSRGPLLFLGATFFIMIFINLLSHNISFSKLRITKNQLIIFPSAVFAFLGIIVAANTVLGSSTGFVEVLERSLLRFSLLMEVFDISGTNDPGVSINNRLVYMEFALESIFSDSIIFFFGSGFASFGLDFLGLDQRMYPHNILIEVWYELGLVGLIIFTLFLMTAIRGLRLRYFNGLAFALLIFYFLNLMKSHSLADLRLFFGLIALSLAVIPAYASKLKDKSKDGNDEKKCKNANELRF